MVIVFISFKNTFIIYLKFDAPIFVTWYQCVVTVVFCFLLDSLSILFPKYISYQEFKIDPKICKDVFSIFKLLSKLRIIFFSLKTLPMSIIFVGMISFNNLSLKYVSISFYMVVRSLTTVWTVVSLKHYFYRIKFLKI